jgi:hypothetical protein
MNAAEFVATIESVVRDAAVSSCVKSYHSPPGRTPPRWLLELSTWFEALSDSDQERVIRAMADAADAAVFGFLCVLDGVRPIEGYGEKGQFELYFTKGDFRDQINDPMQDFLHDLYRPVT